MKIKFLGGSKGKNEWEEIIEVTQIPAVDEYLMLEEKDNSTYKVTFVIHTPSASEQVAKVYESKIENISQLIHKDAYGKSGLAYGSLPQ